MGSGLVFVSLLWVFLIVKPKNLKNSGQKTWIGSAYNKTKKLNKI